MNTQSLKGTSTHRSAFHPIAPKSADLSELETFIIQVVHEKRKIVLVEAQIESAQIHHPFVRVLMSMIQSLKTELFNDTQIKKQTDNTEIVSFHLLKNLALMVEQRLFTVNQKYLEELQSTILFEKSLIQIFKRCFFPSQQTCNLNLQVFDQILMNLSKNHYRSDLVSNVYSLLGGSFLGIQKSNFVQSIYFIVWNIGKIFTNKGNFITRNLKNLKKSKCVNDILNCSVKIICSFQNKSFIEGEIKNIAEIIFGNQNSLRKDEFVNNVKKIEKDPSSHILWLFLDLLRAQTLIIIDPDVRAKINNQREVEESNFYIQQMQKLLKKCPFNGDQCCDCKKCLCVRRNRESAKLSQEKKRNAMELIDPMKIRIAQLERRNQELQEQNSILKGIFNEIKGKQGFKEIISSTLEPISKVLDN